jgi:protein arginine kinase activator
MKCDKCGSPNVVTKIVIQGNKNAEELNLCPNCFQTFVKDHPEIKQGPMGKSLNEFLLGTLNLLNSGIRLRQENDEPQIAAVKQCPGCSTTSVKIIKEGLAGCPQCYTFFKNEINEYLSKNIGVKQAITSPDVRTKEQKISDLAKKMSEAVKTEYYEMAAAIRDEIKILKKQ